MSLHPYGCATKERVARFEATLGFPLPADYREFLIQSNGGKFQAAVAWIAGLEERVALDVFLGLDLESGLNLEHWNAQYRYDVPSGGLIIGTDPGGGFILLGLDPTWAGIYYWDHGFWFAKSSPKENIYLISGTFTELIAMVR